MADVKWIKFMVGTFDGASMKKIKRAKIAGESFRDKLEAIWFELLDLAGKRNNNGKLVEELELAIDSEAQFEDIATMIDRDIDEVKICINWFIQNRMICLIDDLYALVNWNKYQETDKLEHIREQNRLRLAKHREQKRVSMKIENCAYCGGKATGLDHIIAKSRGGNESEENKVPCCIECNKIKNDKPLVDFLNSNRHRIKDFLIIQNPKLNRYVTLCNVTNRYIETLGNAPRIKNKNIEEDINNIIDTNVSCSNEVDKSHHFEPFLNQFELRFESFWSAYPRKVGKQKCMDWFKKHKPSQDLTNKMISTIELWKRSDQWTKQNGQFIPMPYTWLNRGGWDDEPPSNISVDSNNLSEEQQQYIFGF